MIKLIRLLAFSAGAFCMVAFIRKIVGRKGADKETLIDRIRARGV